MHRYDYTGTDKRFGICCIIKNEQEYIQDWIEYHIKLGFSEIHLFEDNGSDSHAHLTEKYSEVHLHPLSVIGDYSFKPGNKQANLYQWFYENYRYEMEWCAFIDADEYIMLEDGYTLQDLNDDYYEYHGLYLFWKYYTANGHIEKPESRNVVETYTESTDDTLPTDGPKIYKSLLNFTLEQFYFIDHHTMAGLFNTKYEPNAFNLEKRTFEKAWIGHFYTKSFDDWFYKMVVRGDIMPGHRRFDEFFLINKDMADKRDECYRYAERKTIEKYGDCDVRIFIHTHKNIENEIPENDFYTITSVNDNVTSDTHDVIYLDDDFTQNHKICYGELTTMRYLWKHPEIVPNIVGLNHYRRFFKYHCDDKWMLISNIFNHNAIITKEHPHGEGNTNAKVMRDSHLVYDADLIDSIVKDHFPQYTEGYEEMKRHCGTHPCNMFVMKKDDFIEMCDFVFGVLDIYDDRQGFTCDGDVRDYIVKAKDEGKWYYGDTGWQSRLQGFWGEWLVEAFFTSKWGMENVIKSDYTIYGKRSIPNEFPPIRKDELIVSLTTWHARMHTVSKTLECLGKAAEGLNARIVLVLGEEDLKVCPLTFDLLNAVFKYKIEIIRDKGDIKSHKKLLPVLEKYPDNDILICDDDKLYGDDFIRNFMNDHEKHPNDIIVGGSFFNLIPNEDGSFTCTAINQECWSDNIVEPGSVSYISKPANGCFGTYYPKHTFTDKRFFDRELMMELSEHSDEDWHFLFNVIEDRTLRFSETIMKYGYPDNNGFTEGALCRSYGMEYYEVINGKFSKAFPEYHKKMLERYQKFLSR